MRNSSIVAPLLREALAAGGDHLGPPAFMAKAPGKPCTNFVLPMHWPECHRDASECPPTPPLRAKQCVIARMPWTIPGIMEHARNHTPRAQQASHRVSRHANLATGTRAVDSHTSAFEKTQFVDNPVLPIPGSGQTPLLSPLANRTPSASKRTSASLRLTACAFKFPSRHGPSPHPTAWQRNHTL